jgi:DNA replication protein DnaC
MDEEIKKQMYFLRLKWLRENWDAVLEQAKGKKSSYETLLTSIIAKEYAQHKEHARLGRIQRANIPEMLVMETFPFAKQPLLDKKIIMGVYDSLEFITKNQQMVFIGPTGCGKTGLATAFLVHAINQGYRGYFIEFGRLMHLFFQSRADHTEQKLLSRFASYNVLLIDELGYDMLEKEQAGLFFDLIKQRNKQSATIFTTQLGFDEWDSFLHNKHLRAALIDRITKNCVVVNMDKCISIRPKNIIHATKK